MTESLLQEITALEFCLPAVIGSFIVELETAALLPKKGVGKFRDVLVIYNIKSITFAFEPDYRR